MHRAQYNLTETQHMDVQYKAGVQFDNTRPMQDFGAIDNNLNEEEMLPGVVVNSDDDGLNDVVGLLELTRDRAVHAVSQMLMQRVHGCCPRLLEVLYQPISDGIKEYGIKESVEAVPTPDEPTTDSQRCPVHWHALVILSIVRR